MVKQDSINSTVDEVNGFEFECDGNTFILDCSSWFKSPSLIVNSEVVARAESTVKIHSPYTLAHKVGQNTYSVKYRDISIHKGISECTLYKNGVFLRGFRVHGSKVSKARSLLFVSLLTALNIYLIYKYGFFDNYFLKFCLLAVLYLEYGFYNGKYDVQAIEAQ